MPPSPEVARTVPEKNYQGGGRQRFFVRRVGCLGAKWRVEEEMNGRCPGGGGALG